MDFEVWWVENDCKGKVAAHCAGKIGKGIPGKEHTASSLPLPGPCPSPRVCVNVLPCSTGSKTIVLEGGFRNECNTFISW